MENHHKVISSNDFLRLSQLIVDLKWKIVDSLLLQMIMLANII